MSMMENRVLRGYQGEARGRGESEDGLKTRENKLYQPLAIRLGISYIKY